jgi:hypothetical protein
MAKAFQIARNDAGELFVPRIRRLLEERADIRGARRLLAEAREHGSLEPELEELEKLLAPPRFQLRPASDFDRSAEFAWLEQHAAEYRGQWVAVLGDRLLAQAATLDEIQVQLAATPPKARPLLHRIY